MRLSRASKLALAAIMILFGGYAGLWFLQAYRIETAIRKHIETLNGAYEHIRAAVGTVDVSGFPFHYTITIGNVQAALVVPERKMRYLVSHMEPIIVHTGFMGNRLQADLPKRLDVTRYSDGNVTGSFALTYTQNPQLLLRFAMDYGNILFVKGFPNISYFIGQFREISYQDKGLRLIDTKTGAAAGSYDAYSAVIRQTPVQSEHRNVHVHMRGDNMLVNSGEWLKGLTPQSRELLKDIVKVDQGTEGYDFNVEFSVVGAFPQKRRNTLEFDLDLKQIAYVSKRYAWNSDGKITASRNDILPSGWFRVNVTNYKDFLDNIIALVNAGIRIAKEGDPLKYPDIQEINEQDKKVLFDTLKAVGSFSGEGKDISVIVARDKGGEVYIGQLPIEEAMVFIQGGV